MAEIKDSVKKKIREFLNKLEENGMIAKAERLYADLSVSTAQSDLQKAINLLSLPEVTAAIAKRADNQEKRILMLEAALKNIADFAIRQIEINAALQRIIEQAKISVGNAEEIMHHKPDSWKDVV